MMSKLAMGTSEKSRSQSTEDPSRGSRAAPPTTPVRTQGITHQTSYGNLSSLANRPVPPRPPPIIPISPPASPSDDEYHNTVPRTRKTSTVAPGGSISQPGTPRRVMPTWEQQMADGQPPVVPTKHVESANGNGSVNGNGYKVNGNGHVRAATAEEQSPRSPSSRRPSAAAASARPKPEIQTQPIPQPQPQTVSPASRKPPHVVALPATPTPPAIAEDQARDMRRLLARATNADECRLLFDIFLAKSGVAVEPTPSFDVPYPSPSPSDNAHPSTPPRDASEAKLELALVELFLGGDEEQAAPQRPRRSKKRSEAAPVVADVPVPDGVTQPRKHVTFAVDAPPARTVSEVGA
ncbi:hypothetical protein FB45DRAFT_425799 [Roridomyces roridus]|uniref:Uncharacterized protein n=1 Tax=Roridomyces roridus TaxID=1738132 RepID=A0AAD7C7I1_9AGAR|nr:hypothetical protein FB45DRAFT_425799 [Roridomyces roridus]